MKTLKVLLLVFLAALALLFIFGLVLMAGWPWWVGFFFLIGILGIILICNFHQKTVGQKKRKKFHPSGDRRGRVAHQIDG